MSHAGHEIVKCSQCGRIIIQCRCASKDKPVRFAYCGCNHQKPEDVHVNFDFQGLVDREPDFVIGDPADPYLRRWFLLPRNEQFNIYLHQILKDDDDRALHDHPWASFSLMLAGVVREHRGCYPVPSVHVYRAGDTIERDAETAHRLEVIEGPVWTLFITGRKVREWGFHCPQGWRHWREFVSDRNSSEIGVGCD